MKKVSIFQQNADVGNPKPEGLSTYDKKGEPLQTVGSRTMVNLPNQASVGLYICSHNPAKMEEALAGNVQLK